jgi:hypothetical protein
MSRCTVRELGPTRNRSKRGSNGPEHREHSAAARLVEIGSSGSGGTLCNGALLHPPTTMSSDEAVTQYRAFLRSRGWIETSSDLLHDTLASSVSLTVEARDPFARKTDQPLGAGEILVTASFADDGTHSQIAAARRTRTVLLVLAPVPGALILVAARRRNTP